LTGKKNGARLYAIDPRRTTSVAWADVWLGLEVGSDVALSNALGREIIAAGLCNTEFITRATEGFEAYKAAVESYTLDRGEELTGVKAAVIREMAHAYARADRAQICWTLGITEHHNAVDNVFAIINLSLLTGHVGRWGSGLVPLRGQNNVQGGGDMGAIPNKFVGGQSVDNPQLRAMFEHAYGRELPPVKGMHLSEMFNAMEHGDLKTVFVLGENPMQSEADAKRTRRLLEGLEHLVVQDIFLTKTAEVAHVVFPAAASWCESEGTVTSSERRVQRVRKALDPPGQAKDDIDVLSALADKLGRGWGTPTARDVWEEVRRLSPWHGGMSYERLEALNGLQWPCPTEDHPGSPTLHTRLWDHPIEGDRAGFQVVHHSPPVDTLTEQFPLRLTTGRRLDSFNTGVMTGGYTSPLRHGERIEVSPEDAVRLGVVAGEVVRVVSRRGAIEAPIKIDPGLRAGLTFMTMHFPDEVETNILTIDAVDPKSGTAEFKAAAIRIEKLSVPEPVGAGSRH